MLNGEYSIRVPATRTESSTAVGDENVNQVKSNAGNDNAITDYTFSYSEKLGWDYTTSFSGYESGLETMVKQIIAQKEGGTAGYYDATKTVTTSISGNYYFTYISNILYTTVSYAFTVGGEDLTVGVTKYVGEKVTTTNTSADQHSGGSSN